MDKRELLDRYESLGVEADFLAAKPLYEQALAEKPDAVLLRDYGYLLECHGRRELRDAMTQYERALELDPSEDKTHYQAIGALAALRDTDDLIARYTTQLAASPDDVRSYRFLATAYVAAREPEHALETIERGLSLAPDDSILLATRGEAKAMTGDPDGALADWRRALELEPEDIGALYSSAFLLEREGRLGEAIDAWSSILEWNESRGNKLDTEWPRRELERLRASV